MKTEDCGVCTACVSVIGSIAAQEVIKAVTHVHMPVNQLLMFESLDSLHDEHDIDNIDNDNDDLLLNSIDNIKRDKSRNNEIDNNNNNNNNEDDDELFIYDNELLSNTAKVYGIEVAKELQKLRIFIVGAGAIGSELLKTLALMGVGSANMKNSGVGKTGMAIPNENIDNTKNSIHKIDWNDIQNGGIVITDMDSIERSNLNRQLLYRERHIGSSKSLVAAEMIKQINPKMNIISLTNKVCPDTEVIFNSQFWKHIDVVLPALDNIDARLYVDGLCVSKKKWLLDSGTLGTKGSTQVVIPGVSESYSSSADPPEDSIPMCTLKSFPYQPEHCISWAKNLFDQLLSSDVLHLKSCLETVISTTTPPPTNNNPPTATTSSNNNNNNNNNNLNRSEVEKKLSILCDTMPPEAITNVYNTLLYPQNTLESAIQWSITIFHDLYEKEIYKLLKEHPLDEKDDEDVPFWGG